MILTALVVDDDDTTRENVAEQLKVAAAKHNDPLRILQAKTAMGGIKSVEDRVLDLAIIDYHLGSGATGVWLISKLIQKHSETQMCLFSDKDPTAIEGALDEAIGSRLTSVQYREKQISQAEINNIYDMARYQILRGNGDFVFGDILAAYHQAFSAHEQLIILNLLWERAVRLIVSIFAPKARDISNQFLLRNLGRPFIGASAFLTLGDELVRNLVNSHVHAHDKTICSAEDYFNYLADSVQRNKISKTAWLILRTENSYKHISAQSELVLRELLYKNKNGIMKLVELVADLRRIDLFRKQHETEFCGEIVRIGRSGIRIQEIETDEFQEVASGALIEGKAFDLFPYIIFKMCSNCASLSIFFLHHLDSGYYYYQDGKGHDLKEPASVGNAKSFNSASAE
jgi:hypothetical protein